MYLTLTNMLEMFLRTSATVGLITLVLFSIYTTYIVYIRRLYAHIPKPPLSSFYFGHAPALGDKTTHKMFIQWAKEHGSIYHFCILHKIMVLVNTPKLAKEILLNSDFKKDKDLYKMSESVAGLRFLGSGLATNTDHENWRVRRTAINPAFHKSTLEDLTVVFNDTADRLMDELDKFADTDGMVSMLDQLHRTTLDVIGQAAFSEDILHKDGDFDFCHAVNIALKTMALNFRNPLFRWLPKYREIIKTATTNVNYLRSKARRMIQTRIKAIENGDRTPNDILDCMIRNLVDFCSQDDLIDEVITMFVAGQETTANLLAFLILELGKDKEACKKMCQEVDEVIGSKRFISQTEVAKLDFSSACLKEVLRLHPPVGGTVREAPVGKKTELDGYSIPEGTAVQVNFFAVQYLHHIDGFQFRPERFSNTPNNPLTPELYSYMPFSLGQRSCVGRNFAYLEAKIIAAKFLQQYTFKLNPKESFEVENAGTFRPVDGVKIFLKRR